MLIAKNRKALHDYEVLEKFTAGIVLKGYEVKAIREGKVSFEGSYIRTVDDRVILYGLHIGRYSKQSRDINETDSKRDRELLLNKNEILKLSRELAQKGKTAIPLAIILINNLIKVEFALVRGRKQYEKKHVVKEKQIKRDMEKEAKQYR